MKSSIKFGNSFRESKKTRNWLVGDFKDNEPPVRNSHAEVKVDKLVKGQQRSSENASRDKTKSTVAILMSGKFKFYFPELEETAILTNEGDYVFFEANVLHAWECLEDSLLITVRMPS